MTEQQESSEEWMAQGTPRMQLDAEQLNKLNKQLGEENKALWELKLKDPLKVKRFMVKLHDSRGKWHTELEVAAAVKQKESIDRLYQVSPVIRHES
jgi:hypothetical protein